MRDATTRDCARCGGWFTTRPGAQQAHRRALGHWPEPATTQEGGDPMPMPQRCDSCGGVINPQTGECRCSD